MRKILLSTFVLILFSISVILFQISCKKEVNAQSGNGDKQLNTLLISKYVEFNNGNDEFGYYTANLDGSGLKKIPISLPNGEKLLDGGGKLTPDGKILIFPVQQMPDSKISLYSCSIDGSNLKLIINATTESNPIVEYFIEGAY